MFSTILKQSNGRVSELSYSLFVFIINYDSGRWVEHGRARAMVDAAGNPFGSAREHNSISTGYGPPIMPVFAKLVTNSRITSEGHEQDVRHIELDLGSSVRIQYFGLNRGSNEIEF